MPLLIRRETGVALEAPSFWITSERRPLGVQASTLEQELRNVLIVYLWADVRGIDLLARLRSPAFLTLSDLNDLDRFCRKRVAQAVAELAHAGNETSCAVRFAAKKARRGGAVSSKEAGRAQVRNRMAAIHGFFTHVSCDHLSRLIPGTDAYRIYQANRDEMLKIWEKRYTSLDLPNHSEPPMGLETSTLERLREVIHPDHPDNSWSPSVRVRNGLIVLLLWSLGIRRGELCSIKTTDLRFSDGKAILSIVRRPSDPEDLRTTKPAVKTLGRELILAPELAELLRSYILNERRRHVQARRHPFLFVSSFDGMPLSLSSVNKLFQVLRRATGLPDDLSPHIMRHTWNDSFCEASERASPRRNDIERQLEGRMQAYLQGWVANSKMPGYYSKRYTRDEANKRSLRLQQGLQHVVTRDDGR